MTTLMETKRERERKLMEECHGIDFTTKEIHN